MTDKEIWTAPKIVDCIRNRFSDAQKYVVLEKVANGTGYQANSWVDVVVCSLWPSLGCRRTAIEIKISRGDWMRELNNPEKNAWAREACHEFYYCAPVGVIKEEELPEKTGLYTASGDTIRVVRAAAAKQETTLNDVDVAAFVRAMETEKQRAIEAVKKDVFANDDRARKAFFWEAAAKTFLHKHGQSEPYLSRGKEAIEAITALENATTGEAERHDREQLMEQTERFRKEICESFASFVQFAYVSIMEVDAMGKFIHDWHGGGAKEAMSRYEKGQQTKFNKVAKLIKELGKPGSDSGVSGFSGSQGA